MSGEGLYYDASQGNNGSNQDGSEEASDGE